jgi:hypothetical protein
MLIGVIRARGDGDAGMATLVSSHSCALPCWMGIVPNETRMNDAIALLRANAGVPAEDIDVRIIDEYMQDASVTWGVQGASLIVDSGVVIRIFLPIEQTFGALALHYGDEARAHIEVTYGSRVGVGTATITASYTGWVATTTLICPVRLHEYWSAPLTLRLGVQLPRMVISYDHYARPLTDVLSAC